MSEGRFTRRVWKAGRFGATFYSNLKDKNIYYYHDFYSVLVREFLLIYNRIHNKEGKKLRIEGKKGFLPMRYNPEVIVSLLVLKWFFHYNNPVKELTNKNLIIIWGLAFDNDLGYVQMFKKIYPDFKPGKLPSPYVAYFSTKDYKDYDPLDKNSFGKYAKYISRKFFKESLDKVLLGVAQDYGKIKGTFGKHKESEYIDKCLDSIIDGFKNCINSLKLGKEFLAKNELSEQRQLKGKTDFEIIASTLYNIEWCKKATKLENIIKEEREHYERNYKNMTESERMNQESFIEELEQEDPEMLEREREDRWGSGLPYDTLYKIRKYLYDYDSKRINKLLLGETGKDYRYTYE